MTSFDEVKSILTDHGIDKDADFIFDLVSDLLDHIHACEDAAESSATEDAFKELDDQLAEAVEKSRQEIWADLGTYIRLAKSDPQSAAVYFHRATGLHLFEVSQPCLL